MGWTWSEKSSAVVTTLGKVCKRRWGFRHKSLLLVHLLNMWQYFRICITWTKNQGFVIDTCELTFFHKCVNNALVTRDRSEVVESATELMEILQLQRTIFLGLSASLALTNCSIESWKNWAEESYLSWCLGECISKASCPTETKSHRLRVTVSELGVTPGCLPLQRWYHSSGMVWCNSHWLVLH